MRFVIKSLKKLIEHFNTKRSRERERIFVISAKSHQVYVSECHDKIFPRSVHATYNIHVGNQARMKIKVDNKNMQINWKKLIFCVSRGVVHTAIDIKEASRANRWNFMPSTRKINV